MFIIRTKMRVLNSIVIEWLFRIKCSDNFHLFPWNISKINDNCIVPYAWRVSKRWIVSVTDMERFVRRVINKNVYIYTMHLRQPRDFKMFQCSNKLPAKNGPPKCPEIAKCDASSRLKWDFMHSYRVQLQGTPIPIDAEALIITKHWNSLLKSIV